MAGSPATRVAMSPALPSFSSSARVSAKYRCGGDGRCSTRPMARRRRGLSSRSRSSSRLWIASSTVSEASGSGRKRCATPISLIGAAAPSAVPSSSAMRMVSERSVRICPSSVAGGRSGRDGPTITASTGPLATANMAALPSATVSTVHSSPMSPM